MPDLMSQGLNLAALGMGTVFFFLTLLVGVTIAMSALVPSEELIVTEEAANSDADPHITAVIAAAIFRYRKKNDHH
jgi:oxaloacetate decarboxylase (Na+ extruding) subunit gamma